MLECIWKERYFCYAVLSTNRCYQLLRTISTNVCLSPLTPPYSSRINGQLVALKVISMNEEEGVPFTAIREGKNQEICFTSPQFG